MTAKSADKGKQSRSGARRAPAGSSGRSKPGVGGRKTKCTPEVRKKIVDALKAGNYAEVACRAAGIGESTYYQWIARGRADAEAGRQTVYAEFAEAVKEADARAEQYAVAMVLKAMPTNWQAAMTFLERRFPKRWRRRDGDGDERTARAALVELVERLRAEDEGDDV